MPPIVMKSKADAQNLQPLADGTYSVTFTRLEPVGDQRVLKTQSDKMTVAKGVYSNAGSNKVYNFDQFKAGLVDQVFAEGTTTQQFVIESLNTVADVPKPLTDKPATAGAAPETPWLLYAGGALLLWLLLSKKD